MNESKQIEVLQHLAETSRENSPRTQLASLRVSPGAYLAMASVITFGSALLLRGGMDFWALFAIGLAWFVMPLLALNDRIAFDGQLLRRRGLAPWLLTFFSGRRQELNVAELERVDTSAVRTLRRRGSVRYRYRSQLIGKGSGFVFASGGKRYREMLRKLFPLIHEDKLDARTIDLRKYLSEPKTLNQDVKHLQLAPADVLDDATLDFKVGGKRDHEIAESSSVDSPAPGDIERAQLLRRLGNQLRIAGRLREAGEAFRRALNVIPHDPWLIYEFARLLRSQASALSDARLLSRARAALRLSAMRAGSDAGLVSLIGETLLECGETERAKRTFQLAIELDEKNYRARLGLADVALRTGKLAHVIHHYREAARGATDKALARYAGREAEYYARLNDDDNYLAIELRRINWLQNAVRVRRLAARVTNASILIALVGPYFAPEIGGFAWAFASSAVMAWISSLLAARLLADRRNPQLSQ